MIWKKSVVAYFKYGGVSSGVGIGSFSVDAHVKLYDNRHDRIGLPT
jgi:hypothetical protein